MTTLDLAASKRASAPKITKGVSGDRLQPWRDARARREEAECRIAELKLAEIEGTLVRRDDVTRTQLRLIASLMSQLEAIPARFAAEFAENEAKRRAMEQRLREELRRVKPEC